MVQAKQFATDDYTFFRERESPAESSLKNKVVIDFHTGAATENGTQHFFIVSPSSRWRLALVTCINERSLTYRMTGFAIIPYRQRELGWSRGKFSSLACRCRGFFCSLIFLMILYPSVRPLGGGVFGFCGPTKFVRQKQTDLRRGRRTRIQNYQK